MDLEERMTHEQLLWFRQHDLNMPFGGPEEMRALFEIWRAADQAVRDILPAADLTQSECSELSEDDVLCFPLPYEPKRR